MTELLDRRRDAKVAARLPVRVDALTRVVDLAAGRLPDADLEAARAVAGRAGERLRLSPEHTVVALAGSTGSGKSSLFNAVAGLDIAQVGVRRPTTSVAIACVWGAEGAGDLLEWLGIERRHQVMRSSVLDETDTSDLHGLVLLDLPDHDSTELSHRVEVERLVELVDMMIWVLDPQKYADAAVHERFLRRMARHTDVVAVVLNQTDKLSDADVDRCRTDLRRLLVEDGLSESPLLVTSALTGQGVDRLRALLADRVRKRRSFTARLSADLDTVTERIAARTGDGDVPGIDKAERVDLAARLAQAAGTSAVAAAVARSYAVRGAGHVGWPPLRWVRKLRPDPLRRLGLDRSTTGQRPELVRSSLPAATPVQRSQVDTAVRRLADAAASPLPPDWAEATRRAARSNIADLPDALDAAIVQTDLGAGRRPAWWRVLSGLQWLLFLATVVGGLWLGLLALNAYVRLPELPTPEVWGFPLPTMLLLGGALLGVLVALLSRPLMGIGARRAAATATYRLRAAVSKVGVEQVLRPVDAERERLSSVRRALAEVAQQR